MRGMISQRQFHSSATPKSTRLIPGCISLPMRACSPPHALETRWDSHHHNNRGNQAMSKQLAIFGSALALAIGGCSSSSSNDPGPFPKSEVSVPGIDTSVVYSFDLGVVDPSTGLYYVTDRTA